MTPEELLNAYKDAYKKTAADTTLWSALNIGPNAKPNTGPNPAPGVSQRLAGNATPQVNAAKVSQMPYIHGMIGDGAGAYNTGEPAFRGANNVYKNMRPRRTWEPGGVTSPKDKMVLDDGRRGLEYSLRNGEQRLTNDAYQTTGHMPTQMHMSKDAMLR